ncbi:hypothetical protein CcCBS67573_g07346 [Chytriomyces confervae]|uniref:Uncharacterized protein n=1 Tax=Chytriomyces confervae TaxID=246404 RepID=A0A507EXL7_9FUNG|nr:hypothetical protein CcCBS67573_g07346 [Chytriomyces confervae]
MKNDIFKTDGLNWSYSRISGSFLLYREVEPTPQHSHNTPPQIPENNEFILRSVRPNTQLIPGGLAKRTMTVEGSCGTKFRLINYFYPNHVQHHYDTTLSINSNSHAALHTPRQDALLRRYYNHPLEPANSRDATPPLAVMSPSSPVFHSMHRRKSSVMNHQPVLFSQPRIPSNQSNTPHNGRLSILQSSTLHFNPPPPFPQHQHPLLHEVASDYLSTRFQTQVQKYGGTLLRRKSFEYLSNHPYWSATPILEPIRTYSAPHIT